MRPLLPVDETRYLSVAWEMWQRQDFLVPYLNGAAYSHKPPLLFWLIHGVWSVTGVQEWSARLVPPLLALLVILQTTLLARRLWPDHVAGINNMVPWLVSGGWFFMLFMTLVQFGLLLTLWVLLAWQGLLMAASEQRRGWVISGVACGLGVLAKGPVVFLFVLPAALLAPWWRSERTNPRWYAGLFFSLLIAAAIALAWAIPAGLAGGEAYRNAIFWGQSAGRMVNSFAHRSPWWLYLLALPLMLLPWLLWPAIWRAMHHLKLLLDESGTRFIVVVVSVSLLLFSLISGKQAKYLLPVLPLLGLLLARLLTAGGFSNEAQRRLRTITLSSAALIILLHLTVIPWLRPAYDLTAISQKIAELQAQGRPVGHLGKYHGQFHFLGRLGKPVTALPFEDRDVHDWLQQKPQGYLILYDRHLVVDTQYAVFSQPYRNGRLLLLPAKYLLDKWQGLDALLVNA